MNQMTATASRMQRIDFGGKWVKISRQNALKQVRSAKVASFGAKPMQQIDTKPVSLMEKPTFLYRLQQLLQKNNAAT